MDLKAKYKRSLSDYDAMVAVQQGLCIVCDKPSKKKLVVEHDHRTGRVRDLACHICNQILGFAHDNPEILDLCAAHLRQHGAAAAAAGVAVHGELPGERLV